MSHILPRYFQQFPFCNVIKIPHTGHFSVIIFQMKHCISVFCIPKHNVTYISRNFFHRSFLFPLLFSTIFRFISTL